MSKEPVARGIIVLVPEGSKNELPTIAKEAASILRAFDAPNDATDAASADYLLVVVEEGHELDAARVPDLKDRAAAAIGLAKDAAEGRAAVAHARKKLRARGATLGARELVFSPDQFGYLGLESDGARERLEILLRALVNDAERLRLRREGWEEPSLD